MENKELRITLDRELTEAELGAIYEAIDTIVSLNEECTITEDSAIVNSVKVDLLESDTEGQFVYSFPLTEELSNESGDFIAELISAVFSDDFVMECVRYKI